jgi:hypothetical protein
MMHGRASVARKAPQPGGQPAVQQVGQQPQRRGHGNEHGKGGVGHRHQAVHGNGARHPQGRYAPTQHLLHRVVAHEPEEQRRADPGGGRHHEFGRTQDAEEDEGGEHRRTEERGRDRQGEMGFTGLAFG